MQEIWTPETGVYTQLWSILYIRCWEKDMGTMEEQQVLLNDKPSLQPWFTLNMCMFMGGYVRVSNEVSQRHQMSGAGITGSFVLPNAGGLELKLGPLEEEQ